MLSQDKYVKITSYDKVTPVEPNEGQNDPELYWAGLEADHPDDPGNSYDSIFLRYGSNEAHSDNMPEGYYNPDGDTFSYTEKCSNLTKLNNFLKCLNFNQVDPDPRSGFDPVDDPDSGGFADSLKRGSKGIVATPESDSYTPMGEGFKESLGAPFKELLTFDHGVGGFMGPKTSDKVFEDFDRFHKLANKSKDPNKKSLMNTYKNMHKVFKKAYGDGIITYDSPF